MSECMMVDDLAQEIRRVDGSHSLGAGALAEALAPWLAAHDREVAANALREAMPEGVRELLDEARRFASSESGRTLPEWDKHRVMPLFWGLIGCLEAAYSQKGVERG